MGTYTNLRDHTGPSRQLFGDSQTGAISKWACAPKNDEAINTSKKS